MSSTNTGTLAQELSPLVGENFGSSLLPNDPVRDIRLKNNRSRSFFDSVNSSNPNDLFRFNLSRTTNVRAVLSQLNGDADLILLDANKTVIQRSIRSGNADENIDWRLGPGTYYMAVSAQGNTSTAYQLRIYTSRHNSLPQVSLGLANDTGVSARDGITSDPTIVGRINSRRSIVDIRAGFDQTPYSSYQSVMSSLGDKGQLQLTVEQLNRVYGSTLTDGTHTLYLQAINRNGGISETIAFTFTLQNGSTQAQLELSQASDSGFLGDSKTVYSVVDLVGQTYANATLNLTLQGSSLNLSTTADTTGRYQFSQVNLALGANVFNFTVQDQAGGQKSFQTTIQREAVDTNDIVLDWNAVLLQAIATDRTPPPRAARAMAIMNTAIYDAVNSITDAGSTYRVNLNAPAGASADAAAAQAAYATLLSLFPAQQSVFDAALIAALAKVPDGQAEQDGIAIGNAVANAILTWRSTDGANATVAYTPGSTPGSWQPTPPAFAPALLPQWPYVTPFAMTSNTQFRPPSPPVYGSAQYAAEIEQVRRLGSNNSTERTADQTQIALFWADGAGTFTPPGHWINIAQQIAREKQTTLQEDARLFALISIAVADAGILCWDTKYFYNQLRPVSAIRDTTTPNLPWTPDPTWTPLIATPPFPDYTSGHSTFSAAASTILARAFGDNTPFTTTADVNAGLGNVTRSFSSFSQAADEAGMSRIYGGIHVMSSNLNGLSAGRTLADYVFQNFLA